MSLPGLPRPPTAEQDSAEFRGVAHSSRRTPALLAVGAGTVLAVALLTRQITPATIESTASGAPISSTTAALPSPIARAVTIVPQPDVVLPDQNPGAAPHPTPTGVPAASGPTELVPAGGAPGITLTLRLPEGWQSAGDSMYLRTADEELSLASISAWRIQRIHQFPCRWSAGSFADRTLMQTARGQAALLSGWWGQDPDVPYSNSSLAPLATQPRPTTVAGRPAWQTSVLITRGFDLSQCDGHQLVLWESGGSVRTALPGELHELFVMELDRVVIVIDSTTTPGLSADDLRELDAMVDSIRFDS